MLSSDEFEKWRAICASARSVCLREWRASMGGVGGVLVWVACQRGWRGNLGYVVDMLAWVTWQRG